MSDPTLSEGWQQAPDWGVVDRPEEGEHGGRLYAAPLVTGEVTVLQGSAAAVTRAALAGGDARSVRDTVAAALEVEPDSIDDEVLNELIGDLVRLGLLRRR